MKEYLVINGRIVLAVSLREAASMLGLSYKTIWRHVHKGLLGAVRRGGVYIVPISALRAYAGSNETNNGDALNDGLAD